MSNSSGALEILIVAGDSGHNLGDQAILLGTCRVLRAQHPDIRISTVLGESNSATDELGIRTIAPGLSGLLHLTRTARAADVILCGGGGLFQDDDSLIKMPFWALRLLFLRLFNKRIIGYSLGVGPLKYLTSRIAARIAFLCLSQVSVRDPIAARIARDLTQKPIEILPDLGLVSGPSSEQTAAFLADQPGFENHVRPLVGIAVRRWFPPKARLIPNKIALRYFRSDDSILQDSQELCFLLAQVLDQLVKRRSVKIVFMPSYNAYHEGDERLCRAIQEYMTQDSGTLLHTRNPDEYRAVCKRLDVLIGGRMHPTIFAASVGTPIVGLAYNPKFHGFFQLLGLESYLVDVSDFVEHKQVDYLATLVLEAKIKQQDIDSSVESLQNSIVEFNRSMLTELCGTC